MLCTVFCNNLHHLMTLKIIKSKNNEPEKSSQIQKLVRKIWTEFPQRKK